MKIQELEVGKIYSLPLVVLSAIARETKTLKQYLDMELFDGTDKINGKYWDWSGKNIPDKNAILDVKAQVTEWQSVKQLNIKSLSTNTDLHISDFTPVSGVDAGKSYMEAYNIACELSDNFLRSLTLGLLEELQPLWLTVPGAKGVHHAYIAGNLIHSLSVAKIAKSIATEVPEANIELVTVGGLLHDIGKLFGYTIDGISCEMTDEGMLCEHPFIGAQLVDRYVKDNRLITNQIDEDKLQVLRHIILSHHGKTEYGAAITPACMEAHIVSHADGIDAAMEQIREASKKATNNKWTEKVWGLENRQHLTIDYVKDLFKTSCAAEINS